MQKTNCSERERNNRGEEEQRSTFEGSFNIRRSPFCRNVKLLSFGADEEAADEEEPSFRKKPIFRPERTPSYTLFDVIVDGAQWWINPRILLSQIS